MSKRITLLPEKIGHNVIKIELIPKESETARAILVVPPGGYINSHSHEKEKNQDSELYIHLVGEQIMEDNELLYVAGSNSPTEQTNHGISIIDKMQIILAIKKGQGLNDWEEYNENFKKYFDKYGVFACRRYNNSIRIVSESEHGKSETIIINPNTLSISYCSDTYREFDTLDNLTTKEPHFKGFSI